MLRCLKGNDLQRHNGRVLLYETFSVATIYPRGPRGQNSATCHKDQSDQNLTSSSYGQATDIDFSITPRLGWRSSVSRHHGACSCSGGFNLNLTIISNYQGAILPLLPSLRLRRAVPRKVVTCSTGDQIGYSQTRASNEGLHEVGNHGEGPY